MNKNTKNYINVTSYLVLSRGMYQVVLTYYINGKRHHKWKSLKLKDVPGNKNLAKKKQKEFERQFEDELNKPSVEVTENAPNDILLIDYLKSWLQIVKPTLEETTFGGYERTIKIFIEYFDNLNIKLCDLRTADIQKSYDCIMRTRNIKYNTIKRYHAVLHKALDDAIQRGYINTNVAHHIKHQKVEQYTASFYNLQELQKLFEVSKGNLIELHILLSTYYGLRRGEVVGLTFEDIDFINKTITIKRTVTHACVDGHAILVQKNRTKNKSSTATLPLIPHIEELLLKQKIKQEYNQKIYGNSYKNKQGYILVDDEGKLILPDRVTRIFSGLLKKNGLRKIRFHDLRHSCASLLLNSGKVGMKEIQQWLRHSNWNTTANLYSHLDSNSKISTANTIASLFSESA